MGMKLLVFLTVLALLGSAAYAQEGGSDETGDGFTIDVALQALEDLRNTAKKNLHDLQENWNQARDGLNQQLASAHTAVDRQQQQCDVLDGTVTQTVEDIEDTKKFIQWLQDQIQDKSDKLTDLLNRRCEVNKNFIHGLKRDKIALSLLEFIRAAIDNKQSFTLASKAEFNKHLASFLAAYSTNNVKFLLQMKDNIVDASQYSVDVDFSVQARTDEQIGTGHVDNNKGELDLDDFAGSQRKDWQLYKQELLEILDGLKAQIQAKIKNAIDDEINSAVALAEYKNTILHEIEQFKRQLAKEIQNLADLEDKLVQDTKNAEECHTTLSSLSVSVITIQDELDRKQAEFDNKERLLTEEVDLFSEVIAVYEEAVSNTSDAFKARQDDYIADGDFDDGTYDEREVPKIQTLNPPVEGQVE